MIFNGKVRILMEKSIKRNLELASDKSKNDSNAKNLLSEKDILANILQTVVHEFHQKNRHGSPYLQVWGGSAVRR